MGCFQGLFQNKHGLSLCFAVQSILGHPVGTWGRFWGAPGQVHLNSGGGNESGSARWHLQGQGAQKYPKMRIFGEETKGAQKSSEGPSWKRQTQGTPHMSSREEVK